MSLNPTRQNIHKGRLLVIDADDERRLSVESIIAPQGYQVVSSASWPEARRLLQQGHFDLVLSDLQAGQGRGEETAKTLLALGATEVLVGVDFPLIHEGRAALRHGATGYMLQPYDAEELEALIDRCLYRNEEAESHRRLLRENSELRGSRDIFLHCLPLLQVDDLNRLGDLVLDTFMELCAAEAGVLWLAGVARSDLRLHSLRGLPPVGAGNDEALAMAPESPLEPNLSADRQTLCVPLLAGGKLIGLAHLESPVGREAFSSADLQRVESAVVFTTVALFALLRRQEFEHNLLRAPGSQAYNMTFFSDHLEKGLYAAKRYDRKLSLIKIVVANYAELSARFLDRQVTDAVEKMVATIMTVLRDADLICSVLPGQFYVLLPETDSWGALMAQRRMRKALSGQLLISDLKKNLPIRVQMRSATAPLDATTLPELDRLLEARLAMLRRSFLLHKKLEEAPFWKIVETLLSPTGASLLPQPGESRATFIDLADGEFAPFALAVCHELLSAVPVRGVILWGSDDLALPRSVLGSLLGAHETRTALYLLGKEGKTEALDLPAGTTIPLEDEALRDQAFLLCLGEDYAYALLARREGGHWRAFHTDDAYFVENMLAKLQDQYQFQAQI